MILITSNIIDEDDPHANMYGCQPCPKCHKQFRAAYRQENISGTNLVIKCDDCGFEEHGVEVEHEET